MTPCPACAAGRRHTAEETAEFHPLAGHGCHDGKWTSGDTERAPLSEREKWKAWEAAKKAAAK